MKRPRIARMSRIAPKGSVQGSGGKRSKKEEGRRKKPQRYGGPGRGGMGAPLSGRRRDFKERLGEEAPSGGRRGAGTGDRDEPLINTNGL